MRMGHCLRQGGWPAGGGGAIADSRLQPQRCQEGNSRADCWESKRGEDTLNTRIPSTPLIVEDGILLKQYSLSWGQTESGSVKWGPAPKGWTPDDTSVAVRDAANSAIEENEQMPPTQALLEAALREGKVYAEARQPWPGWMPVLPMQPADRRAFRAYRNVFKRINPQFDSIPAGVSKDNTFGATWPPDGTYNLRSSTLYFWPTARQPCPRCYAREAMALQSLREGMCKLCGLDTGQPIAKGDNDATEHNDED